MLTEQERLTVASAIGDFIKTNGGNRARLPIDDYPYTVVALYEVNISTEAFDYKPGSVRFEGTASIIREVPGDEMLSVDAGRRIAGVAMVDADLLLSKVRIDSIR